jgi:cation:H+ antiporter
VADSAPLALLLVGLATIVWATHIAVENAIVVARHHRVSDFFIGVVVLAVGSDLPEIVVSLDAALRQLADQETDNLIIGNAIGSCFGQLGMVIGIAGLIGRLSLPREQLLRHGGFLLAATVGLFLVGLDGAVSRVEGTLMVLSFVGYVYLVIHEEGLVTGERSLEADEERESKSISGNWVRLLIGLAAVVLSAELIVQAAMTLAASWGVDQSFIGIAIIGVGTSLPEVLISIAAVLKRRAGLSVGNLLGSNILDTLLPIGLAALLVDVSFPRAILTFDLPMLMGMTVLVLSFLFLRGGVRWPQAAVVLAAYCSYLITLARAL